MYHLVKDCDSKESKVNFISKVLRPTATFLRTLPLVGINLLEMISFFFQLVVFRVISSVVLFEPLSKRYMENPPQPIRFLAPHKVYTNPYRGAA